jgi:hypothetical protein
VAGELRKGTMMTQERQELVSLISKHRWNTVKKFLDNKPDTTLEGDERLADAILDWHKKQIEKDLASESCYIEACVDAKFQERIESLKKWYDDIKNEKVFFVDANRKKQFELFELTPFWQAIRKVVEGK